MQLKDKICLVTGGTRGIGAAAAIELARRGASVAVCGRSPDEEALRVKSEIEALGQSCLVITADMAKPVDAARCVQETVAAFGGLDVLVHAAGGPAKGALLEVNEE